MWRSLRPWLRMRFKIRSSVLIVNADSDLASSIKCLREHFLKKAINAIARPGRRAHARDSQPILELSPGGLPLGCSLARHVTNGSTMSDAPCASTTMRFASASTLSIFGSSRVNQRRVDSPFVTIAANGCETMSKIARLCAAHRELWFGHNRRFPRAHYQALILLRWQKCRAFRERIRTFDAFSSAVTAFRPPAQSGAKRIAPEQVTTIAGPSGVSEHTSRSYTYKSSGPSVMVVCPTSMR
jgi:hypothetical protein